MKIGIIGCGMFGYAIGSLLAETHEDMEIQVTDIDEDIIDTLNETGHHPYFFKDVKMPENLKPVKKGVLEGADIVVLAVPAQYMRKTVEELDVPEGAILLNVSKALERGTDKRMSEVIKESIKGDNPIATISGGMLAGDVIHGHPVGADLACADEKSLRILRELFLPTTVHVDTTTDIAGIEFGGSFKNVIAIGAGIVDGLEFGTSAKAFFVAQALREIELLSVEMGARHETFHTASNAWMGDLMTTCFGNSRNRYFGELLGKGHGKEEAVEILEAEKKHAEGLATLQVVNRLLDDKGIDAPFLNTLYDVVYGNKDAEESFQKISLFQLKE